MKGSHQKYSDGECVFANAAPNIKLIVRRFVDRVYFCRRENNMQGPDYVYFERELSRS